MRVSKIAPLKNPHSLLLEAGFCVILATAANAAPPSQPPPGFSKCQTCHGENGDSPSGSVPRLNGQQQTYLAERLRSFADPTRQTAHATYFMWEVNSKLSNQAVQAMTGYLAAQPPTAASALSGRLAEQGRQLYGKQDGPGLLACKSCHGPQAEGRVGIPRLAGQHGQYLRRQMESFSLMTRVSGAMNPHTRMLKPDEISALVAYLAND
jgi:cytochrome c553